MSVPLIVVFFPKVLLRKDLEIAPTSGPTKREAIKPGKPEKEALIILVQFDFMAVKNTLEPAIKLFGTL